MKTLRAGTSATLDSSHAIDLAPRLDFVLNLLIFFIITAIFIKEATIDVSRPNTLDGEIGHTIQILVLETGEVFFDGRPVDMRAIRANVERKKAERPTDLSVLLMTNDGTATGTLMSVIDQVRLGGLTDITFTTGG